MYSRVPGAPPGESRALVGSLWAGPDAVLTGAAALRLHGVELPRATPALRFLVPASQRSRRSAMGFETVRTRRPPTRRVRGGVGVAALERALVDAGRFRELTRAELMGVTVAVLQRLLTTDDRIAAEIEGGRPAGTLGVHDGVRAHRGGAWSCPEADLAVAVEGDSRLPVMLLNPELVAEDETIIGIPDGYFPEAGVVLQVHSRRYHDGLDASGRDRWVDTVERDNRYARHGLVVVPVTPTTLAHDLPGFLDALVEILAGRAGGRGHGSCAGQCCITIVGTEVLQH